MRRRGMRRARLPMTRERVVAVSATIAGLALMVSVAPAAASRPSPAAGSSAGRPSGQERYAGARRRAQGLVRRMTLDEKVQMVHGIGNGAKGVTAFPAAISSSATWDTSLVGRYGRAIGREQAGKGNNVALAP